MAARLLPRPFSGYTNSCVYVLPTPGSMLRVRLCKFSDKSQQLSHVLLADSCWLGAQVVLSASWPVTVVPDLVALRVYGSCGSMVAAS